MIFDVPWPSKNLSPNARVHWSAKARSVKAARQAAAWVSQGYGPIEADRLRVTLVFSPPDGRHRDADNLIASAKPTLDGLADSLGVNDRQFEISYRIAPKVKGGNVRIEIEAPE